jgi:hypothetical protein
MARDINGQWTITQSNGSELMFDIVQDENGFLHGSGQVIGGMEANAHGQLTGDSFVYQVDWNNNGKGGRYTGTFNEQGHLSGSTEDLDNPSNTATWFAHKFIHT